MISKRVALLALLTIGLPRRRPAPRACRNWSKAGTVKIGVISGPARGTVNDKGETVGYDVDVANLLRQSISA